MLKFQKILYAATAALALGAAPMAVSAQVAGDAASGANPTTNLGTTEPAGPPAQLGTTAIPPSEPALQPQPQAAAPADVSAFVEQQFSQADANGDGSLTVEEFQPWMAQLKAAESANSSERADTQDPQTYASNAFAAADTDGDGQLSKVELTQFLSEA